MAWVASEATGDGSFSLVASVALDFAATLIRFLTSHSHLSTQANEKVTRVAVDKLNGFKACTGGHFEPRQSPQLW